ncbi:MAG: type III pantothenate kinase [Lachnospiraceae bacterium]|nr:type III pantothenate kinase [Lachnospiraceae bacterium]
MLLAFDVGNTNITIGLFDKKELIGNYRMTTKLPRTSDEYGTFFINILSAKGVSVTDVEAAIIASVVPNVNHSLTNAIKKYIKLKPIMVGPGIKTGISIRTDNPRELGADRIVDAVGAYEMFGGPILVIDYGTATTYDLVMEDGSFMYGVTAPGVRLSANALWVEAAKLPEIEIVKPDTILAKSTVPSMQAGLFYGHIGETEYIIKKMREEAGLDSMKVVATGGLGKIISESTDAIDEYDPHLTLKGLQIIYEKQQNK